MQVFFILFSVYFAVYQYINSKCLYRTHVNYCAKVLIYFEKHVQKLTKGADKPTKQHNRLRQQPKISRR